MSANTSLGGIVAQGTAVEKLQEVQHQGPEGQRQRALTAAEEEKLQQQKQVRETPEGEKNLSVTEREAQKHDRQESDDTAKKRRKSGEEQDDDPRKSTGGHIIDIVV